MSDTVLSPSLERALEARRELIARLEAEQTNAYRLFHGTVEGRPGLTVDHYGNLILVQSFHDTLPASQLAEVEAFYAAAFPGSELIYNDRSPANSRIANAVPPDRKELATTRREFSELGVKYWVQARHDGQDPWLFLDLRAARRRVMAEAEGKSVLNVFAYTCGVGIAAAKAGVATAQLTYNSKKELFAKNVVSQYDLSTANNNLLTAKAQLAQAEAQRVNAANNLSYTVVKAPTDGVVGTLPYRVGALVSASIPQPLTTVSDNSEMYVYFSMTENQLLALTRQYGSIAETLKSMPGVQLQLSDGSTYDQTGRVESISGVIDTSTGSVSLRAAFPNPNGLLHSGGAGNIILPSIYKDCIAVPQAATFELQNKVYVYKVVDGKASSAMIDVEKISNGREYIARAGLVPGDVIVAEGVGLLREGTPIVPKGQAAAAAAAAPATDESAAQTQTEKEE